MSMPIYLRVIQAWSLAHDVAFIVIDDSESGDIHSIVAC